MPAEFLIVGQGLMGTCLAWALERRGVEFQILDREREQGSSRVAAGLITPITGKGLNPSWRQDEFLPEALAFYQRMETRLDLAIWHQVGVTRVFGSEKERRKAEQKFRLPSHQVWMTSAGPDLPESVDQPYGSFWMPSGGWVDLPKFLDASRRAFEQAGRFSLVNEEEARTAKGTVVIRCEGSAALIEGERPHRCAKGEILTASIPGLGLEQIVNRSGWLVPLGGDRYRAGATYEWDELDENPTAQGREKIGEIIRRFTDLPFTVLDHRAGVRPIIRQSVPLVEDHGDHWWVNGLGSKGSIYAPGVAERVVSHLIDKVPIDPILSGLDPDRAKSERDA